MSLKLNERYPARFNNPSADYPCGSFKNRTTPDAKDGSYLEKDWANDKEGFFQSVLAASGAAPNGLVDKVGASQFFDCMLQLTQNQVAQAFPTAGTATALTLTPVPAIPAYAANQRFSVKFHVASGASPTLNASAKGAKFLKQYDSSGAKVAAVFAASQVSDIFYDGTDWILLNALPASNVGRPISFLANGTYTPTAGVKYLYFEIQGAGGAGGPAAVTAASQFSCGGGGASGAYGKGILTAAQIGSSQAITVGVGGVGSTSNVGNVGTATSIGALATASGGAGGIGSGAVASGATSVAVGGSAGLATTGASIINSSGQSGATGFITGIGVVSGLGAGSGVGGGMGGGNAAGAGQAGSNGTAPGAGGGGSGNNVSTATIRQGGSGANGAVFIWEFF